MAKTDYTKAENLLTEGLLKMTVSELLELADKASSFKHPEKATSLPSLQARVILLSFMEHDLELLSKVEGAHLSELGITPKELKEALDKAKELSLEDWIRLKKIRERVLEYKQELWDKIPHASNEELVEQERKKHVYKRFNVRDKWLPLH